jgi:UPF0755 protein
MMKRLLIGGVALVVVIAAVGAFAIFRRPTPGIAIEVDIASGSTTTAVAELLSEKEVISSTFLFRAFAKVRGLDGRIEAGRYEMAKGMGEQAALDILSEGPIEKGTSVSFPEGFALKQVAARIGARTHITEASFLKAATDGSVRAAIEPPNVETLEGFLFPETYVVGEREDAPGLVRRMVKEFEARTAELDWSYAESKGLSKYQALVIASLVEREARLDEDRPKVAAVIYNRLAKGMRLQIDITALYGLDQHKVPVPSDLRRPSPYNTYLIDGLPPTPIANPGLDSLKAALAPANINAIFYVVIDPSGKEGFTDSPQEFERLKQQRPPEVH